jgi:hypothetical protein
MSSVTRFLRQIPTGVGLVNPASLTLSALDFVPASGNYVGNYPPGYVVPASQTGLSTALANAAAANAAAPLAQAVIRDMGKTIFCPYVATVGASTAAAPSGYFREYQLLMVNPISATQGFIGGVGGNNFGVVGPAPATAPGTSTYVTFYLPSMVAGVGSAQGTLPTVNVQAGLQM